MPQRTPQTGRESTGSNIMTPRARRTDPIYNVCLRRGQPGHCSASCTKGRGNAKVRERHWLLAYADDKGELRSHIDAKVAECPEFHEGVWQAVPWRTGMADGVAGRMDRYEATGNGQVSIVAAAALWALAHADC